MIITTKNNDTYTIFDNCIEYCKTETSTVITKSNARDYVNFLALKLRDNGQILYDGDECTFAEFAETMQNWHDIDHVVIRNNYYKIPYVIDKDGNNINQSVKYNNGTLEITIINNTKKNI